MAKSDPNLLTQAEYARSRKARGLSGGTRESVRKAVDDKRISVFGPDKLIDQALADSQWERNTRARFSPEAAGGAAAIVQPSADLLGQAATPEAPAASPPPAAAPAVDTGYTQARARRENAEAEQAEMDLRKRKGELVERIDVDRAGYEIARDIRDAMESAVNSAAAEMAAMNSASACADALRRHNRAICDLLVKGFREKLGAAPQGAAA
jgi:hypothetical protein